VLGCTASRHVSAQSMVATGGSIMHATSLHPPPASCPGRDNKAVKHKVEEQQTLQAAQR